VQIGWIYFVFFFPRSKKKRGNPTHIARIAKAPRAYAKTKALPKSATDRRELTNTIENIILVSNFANAHRTT